MSIDVGKNLGVVLEIKCRQRSGFGIGIRIVQENLFGTRASEYLNDSGKNLRQVRTCCRLFAGVSQIVYRLFASFFAVRDPYLNFSSDSLQFLLNTQWLTFDI